MSSINPIVGNILQQVTIVVLEASAIALSVYLTDYIKKSNKQKKRKTTRKPKTKTTSRPTESLGN